MVKSEGTVELIASWRRWPIIILFFIFCTNTAFQVNTIIFQINLYGIGCTVQLYRIAYTVQAIPKFKIIIYQAKIQFTQMLSVSDVVGRYYRVDENVIVWMTTLTHVTQAVFEIPAAFLSGLTSLRVGFIQHFKP